MIYFFIVLILMLVAFVLWAIVCFHYVLQNQRRLNAQWQRVDVLLAHRNNLMGALQGLWAAPGAPTPDADIQHMQDLLARDTELHWQAVEERAELRKQIESRLPQVLAQAQQLSRQTEDGGIQSIEQALRENTDLLRQEVERYNRTVQVYNTLLQDNPNRAIARKLDMRQAPGFSL